MTFRLATLAIAAALALLSAAPAAAEPCWQRVISDWSDGRIDNVYSPACYRGAIAHLPADVDRVSTAPADLERGLAQSLVTPAEPRRTQMSTIPVLIVIAAAGAFLLLSTARMIRARRG